MDENIKITEETEISENEVAEEAAEADETAAVVPQPVRSKKIPGRDLADWAQALAFSVIPVVLIFSFFIRIIGVVGDSMLPTLHWSDRVVISNLCYTPQHGDIVVISKRSDVFPEPIIKRIIATEGETIRFDFTTGCVWVDDKLLEEEYIADRTHSPEDLKSGVDYTVPEGCVFVMGDNRNDSSDSRKSEIGMVDTRYIIGRVLFRIFPFNKLGKVN